MLGPRRDETGWIAATAIALVLANATKYASALFDPVVVAIVILNAWPLPAGTKAALSRGAALAAYVTVRGDPARDHRRWLLRGRASARPR